MEIIKAPETLEELRTFYLEVFRPLYDHFMNRGEVAQEIHAEMAAALDHFLCRSSQPDATELARVAGHLKRATFDGFKLVYSKEIAEPYRLYMDGRYADVHDGKFRKEIASRWCEATQIADEARALERLSRGQDTYAWHGAFAKWQELMPIAKYFNDLANDETILRARSRSTLGKWLFVCSYIVALVIGVISGILANWLYAKFVCL